MIKRYIVIFVFAMLVIITLLVLVGAIKDTSALVRELWSGDDNITSEEALGRCEEALGISFESPAAVCERTYGEWFQDPHMDIPAFQELDLGYLDSSERLQIHTLLVGLRTCISMKLIEGYNQATFIERYSDDLELRDHVAEHGTGDLMLLWDGVQSTLCPPEQ